jgi:WD40 repeat protein
VGFIYCHRIAYITLLTNCCAFLNLCVLGKRPSLYLWDAHTAEFVKEIGKGFFARAVCAATFSHDTAYVYAAGCDDKHSLGIWDVHTGVLVCETTLCNGIPPQIRSLVAAPDLQYTTYINSKHDGLNDCFVTSGTY